MFKFFNYLKLYLMRSNRQKYTAFSFAEVLLAMTILGIVASYTIPVLLQQIQDATLKTAWKREYTVLAQATSRVMMDNGGTMMGAVYNGGAVIPAYSKYMTFSKVCAWPNSAECWASTTISDLVAGAVQTNGMLIQVDGSGSCSFVGCVTIRVDVNGYKKPNTCGQDIFEMHVLADRVIPAGGKGALWVDKACLHNSAKYLYQ